MTENESAIDRDHSTLIKGDVCTLFFLSTNHIFCIFAVSQLTSPFVLFNDLQLNILLTHLTRMN